MAYVIARHGGRYKNALIALLVVPFFANYLVRMYGWQTLLSDEGVVHDAAARPRASRRASRSSTPRRR